ncbi:MAG: murein biosynthesis integral membrane protein MurJ [Deltaproteobacteria bacterium HGW-Deltaproteobacteria-13]|jgi:putative peptidoglycan lipid II flippase|nr:MAG: murein biosynthesis integral membrane protein MurJ [Deltaproteobacteria bacterium HGW-Deltaproteobacteria-13]
MKKKGNSENTNMAKAAGVVGAVTMVSRVFGLLRDTVIAAIFGANWMTDAFWIAFRIPTTLSRLLGEGSLTASFVPVFTEYLHKRTKEEALELVYNAFTILSMILAVISVLGIVFSPLIVGLIGHGFTSDPRQFALAVFLNRLMFPYIFVISLGALCMGILNSFRHFTAPALSPVMFNISIIVAALGLRSFFAEPITALAIGVLIGGVLQLAMQWPFLRKFGVKLKFRFNFRHPGIRQAGWMLIPAILGAGVTTINVFIGSTLASMLPGGSVTYLFYADRIMELPLGVFAIAIGTASLPSFSRHVAAGNMDELKSSISFSLRLMLFLTIPATFALMTLNLPIISVLFQRGAFDATSAIYTSEALFFYGMGLWAFSIVRVFVQSFYSLQDAKWPMRAAIISLVINLVVSLALMYSMKHKGLALANSLAATVNVFVLSFVLRKKIGIFLDRSFYTSVLKIILSAVVMVGAIMLVDYFMPWDTSAGFKTRLIYLATAIVAGAGAFFISAYVLKSQEIHALMNMIKKRLSRP